MVCKVEIYPELGAESPRLYCYTRYSKLSCQKRRKNIDVLITLKAATGSFYQAKPLRMISWGIAALAAAKKVHQDCFGEC